MNSKSLPYDETANSVVEIPALPRQHAIAALARTVIAWFTRSDLEQAQTHYRIRRERAARAEAQRDIVNALPLAEKHGLGLYRLMD